LFEHDLRVCREGKPVSTFPDRIGFGLVAPDNRDGAAYISKPAGHAEANSAVAAGDDGDFA
jgi:hypothetical protein